MPFDSRRAQQPAEEFVTDVLTGLFNALVIVVGEDFRFGHRAAGDVALLRRLGADLGFTVDAVEKVGGGSIERWSSSVIRDLVASGDVAAAAEALGRPFRFEGVVVRGEGRGRRLGFPTANVPVRDGEVVPACQQTCPAEAIVFGNVRDPSSRVAQLLANERTYRVLDELINTQPGVSYLKKVTFHAVEAGHA